MTQLFEIKVKLSENQKKNIGDAYRKRETIVIRLTNDSLRGNDTLFVPATVKKRLEKNRKENKGMDIKLSKTNIRKQVGGSLLTSILSLGRVFTLYTFIHFYFFFFLQQNNLDYVDPQIANLLFEAGQSSTNICYNI